MELPPDPVCGWGSNDDNSKAVFITSELISCYVCKQVTDVVSLVHKYMKIYCHGYLVPQHATVIVVSICDMLSFSMMFYHDGLRNITAEMARHSSNTSGIPI